MGSFLFGKNSLQLANMVPSKQRLIFTILMNKLSSSTNMYLSLGLYVLYCFQFKAHTVTVKLIIGVS